MTDWKPMSSAPKDGIKALWWVDFRDGTPAVGLVVGYWTDDVRGFCLKCGEGDSWHERGVVAWAPYPEKPDLKRLSHTSPDREAKTP